MLQDHLMPTLAFNLLRDCETRAESEGVKCVSDETLLELYAYFGNTLTLAAELLEKCKIFKYYNSSKSRTIFRIRCNSEWYTIYENINFCRCASFQTQVLEDRTALTCKHVLAVKLNTITGVCNICCEEVTDSRFVDFLNAQLKNLDDDNE